MADLFYLPARPAFSPNGVPIPGAILRFFLTGTSTPRTAYADAMLSVPIGNSATANAAGTWDPIYLDTTVTYRIVLYDADGELIEEYDPYVPGNAGEGAPGKSAYQVAVTNGFVGTEAEWLASLIPTTFIGGTWG